jgi:hypothetical protein
MIMIIPNARHGAGLLTSLISRLPAGTGAARVTWLSPVVALLMALPAEAQFYRPHDPFAHHRRVDTYQPKQVLPTIAVEGDRLLTGWGPSSAKTPGIALVQLSTGQALWTVVAEPEESLAAWLNGEAVYLQRYRREAEMFDLQWRDTVTGAVRSAQQFPIDPATDTVTQFLETVIITGQKEVLDKQTGQRRGILPAEVYYNDVFCEMAGKLYGHAKPEPPSLASDLLEVDLERCGSHPAVEHCGHSGRRTTRASHHHKWKPTRFLDRRSLGGLGSQNQPAGLAD